MNKIDVIGLQLVFLSSVFLNPRPSYLQFPVSFIKLLLHAKFDVENGFHMF